MDLSKSFYTLNHCILFDKLKFNGTRRSPTFLNLGKHYLSTRKQCVEIDRVRSFYIKMYMGSARVNMWGHCCQRE